MNEHIMKHPGCKGLKEAGKLPVPFILTFGIIFFYIILVAGLRLATHHWLVKMVIISTWIFLRITKMYWQESRVLSIHSPQGLECRI